MDHYIQTMLATQASHVVHEGKLDRNRLVRVKQYQANSVKGKNILIILDLEVIENIVPTDRLGSPVAYEASPAPQAAIGGAGFYGTKKEEPASSAPETKPMLPRAPVRVPNTDNSFTDIANISLYLRQWHIKGRVTTKSPIRTWHKPSGEGKLFSFNLLDESGEIKVTAFNEQVDEFYDIIQEGAVYCLKEPCRVNLAKKQFTNLAHEYELTLERGSVISKAEDQESVPQIRYTFCNLRDLDKLEKDATIDVIGILKEIRECSSITSRNTGKPYDKRDLILVDDSGFSVRTTVWGRTATDFDAKPESVVALKGVRVSEFGNARTLSLLQSGQLNIEPDITEAHHLKGWYDSIGRNGTFMTLDTGGGGGGNTGGRQENFKTIADVKESNIGADEPAYFSTKATIIYFGSDKTIAYPACGSDDCRKKVFQEGSEWRCEKCNMSFPAPVYRYTLQMNVGDETGLTWLSGFDEQVRTIMGGKTANELMALRETDMQLSFKEFDKALFGRFNFRVRAKMENYNDVQK